MRHDVYSDAPIPPHLQRGLCVCVYLCRHSLVAFVSPFFFFSVSLQFAKQKSKIVLVFLFECSGCPEVLKALIALQLSS